jgi:hypothetical protein
MAKMGTGDDDDDDDDEPDGDGGDIAARWPRAAQASTSLAPRAGGLPWSRVDQRRSQGAEELRFQHPAALLEGLSQTIPRRGRPSTSLPPTDASAEKLRFSAAC